MKALVVFFVVQLSVAVATADGFLFSAGQELRPERAGDGTSQYRSFSTFGVGWTFKQNHFVGLRYHTSDFSTFEGNQAVSRSIQGYRLDYGYSILVIPLIEATLLAGIGTENEKIKTTIASSVTTDETVQDLLSSAGVRAVTTGLLMVGAEVRMNYLKSWNPSTFPSVQLILGLKF